MKKCYPKDKYAVLFIYSIVFFIAAMMPIFIKIDESISIIIIWVFISGFISVLAGMLGLYNFQFYKLIGDVLILRNAFGKMEKIDLNKAVYEVKDLNTKIFLIGVVKKKWICIYEKNENTEKFERGCSNRKGMHRIQIIYSEKFLLELEKRNVRKLVE